MIKTLKNSLPLLLATSLAACGLAEPTDPNENPDKISPKMIKSEPANKGTLSTTATTISLKLDEAIDPSTLVALNNMTITSLNNEAIDGTWSFDDTSNELVFTLDNRANIPAGQQFKIEINGQITDIAKNPLVANIEFSTPGLFDINITAEGLLDGDNLIITHGEKTATIDANNQTFTIDSNLANKATYSLSISQQAQNSFCSLSNTTGTMSSKDANLTVKCHNVKPVYSTASDWNQYYNTGDETWVHGGELRNVSFPNLNSCDGIYAADSVDAFAWTCSLDNNGQVKFTSTGLKTGKNLSDLISFGVSPNWKEMKLSVLGSVNDNLIDNTGKGIWWMNPVTTVTNSTPTSLPSAGTIYLIQENSPPTAKREIKNSGIALVIKPGLVLEVNSPDAAILIASDDSTNGTWQKHGTWLEGRINAANSHTGVKINNSTFVTLNNVTAEYAKENGIEITSSLRTRVLKSISNKNNGNGIHITNRKDTAYDSSLIQDTLSTNNQLSGLVLTGPNTTLLNVAAANNTENGIEIYDHDNKLSNVSSSNNRMNGLVFSGASNNIITSATISSNGVNGLRFGTSGESSVITNSKNNVLSNITIANNMGSGVKFDTEDFNNNFLNILDAYNATSDCPDTTCNNANFTTVSLNDIPVTDLFSAADSDSVITTYASSDTLHFLNATVNNKFENQYRAWGSKDGITDEAGSGSCNHIGETTGSNTCAIFDWRLTDIDEAFALNKLQIDSTANQHTFLSATEATSFLKNAVEIMSDNIGNENGLCETAENCLFTPNVGNYQGTGAMTKLDSTNDLTATLFRYDQNSH